MQTGCRSSLFLLILLFLAGIPAGAQTKDTKPATKAPPPIVLEARMVSGYKSVCDLKKPPFTPNSVSLSLPVVEGFAQAQACSGCAEWDKKEVFAVVLKATNNTSERKAFKPPLPSEITIATAKGVQHGEALYFLWGSPSGFCTFGQAELETEVEPSASVEFLYLLPKTTLPLAVHVAGYGRVPIEKGK